MREGFLILLLLPVIVHSCDLKTHYAKDNNQCCKMCQPGTRMHQDMNCQDPICLNCEDGEYQDVYNKDTKCKEQPMCDPNLNFAKQTNPSKKKFMQCQCIPDHHCSTENCDTCVRNTVCQAGESIKKMGNQTSDTECEKCPDGTFSNTHSARTCQPWTECVSGFRESVQGSSTYDRSCEATTNVKAIVCSVVAGLFLVVLGTLLYCYRRGKRGAMDLEKKLQEQCGIFCKTLRNNQPFNDVPLEDEMNQMQGNEPEEDTEDQLKHGVSANGMPVRQDNSKASLISQPETASPSESI
ncbi:tumor necrosis factor receptor superfamily member 5 isoform X1 [Electrophorus electricus]|uniref:TNFR-Cys domain-containing protein n=1 Tax=Electrophorus electricus TaxID=8005 RepID=A0A4W4HMN5_ELEEL|nr:tumor necrosis factor receptor superfamily member 5 isoform X1 [Electrophorus electricus]